MNDMKVAIIGAGNMGGAVAKGLAAGSLVAARDISVSNPSTGKLDALRDACPGIRVTTSNREAAQGADVVVLAVKPWKVREVLEEIRGGLDYERQILASLAGGVGTEQLSAWLDRGDGALPPAVYQVIPNTAVAVRQGMTFLCSRHSTPQRDAELLALFRELGDALLVEERLMGAGMAVASCGIAYALRYIRAASSGGVELGLSPRDARRAVAQTLRGAAALLEASGAHPEEEIDRVTTPGGFTIRGLNAMEEAGFTAAVVRGLRASV